jgi:Ca2+-binding EF-hand superfamily protein
MKNVFFVLEHFSQICSAGLRVLTDSGLLGFRLRFGSVTGFFKPAPSPKPRQQPKILAARRYIFSVNALAILISINRLPAQTNLPPVRLALIAETGEVSAAVDILTAKLSGNGKIELLERDEIEKIYQEQGLSAANQDYLKLGRLLGADGLLLLNVARTPETTNLTARLIAVKPGVILADGNFDWPLKDTAEWSESAGAYLDSFLPKLSVLPKDAIPISVVNLRSAINSTAGGETERQLKQLIIQRLSQEPRFFVLERQKMQLLGDEKELKADDSAFWDGSYLLEGIVDQNGYSPDTITINARLTPPKGSTPILMKVSGSRTNLAEVINQLAAKITGALKINSQVTPWNANDEAVQFCDEAKWALCWGAYPEAQTAAESAWALGKTDLDCASVRLRSYLAEEEAGTEVYQEETTSFGAPGGYDSPGKPKGGFPDEGVIQADIRSERAQHPWGLRFKETADEAQKVKEVDYVFLPRPPDPGDIARALHTLELYDDYSRTSRDGQLEVVSDGKESNNWYELGIEDLIAASRVLREFNAVPESQGLAAGKLSDLRALTRSTADLISQSPKVHDSYFVGDRMATFDELYNTIEAPPNIFKCEVDWGCFWQESPEDSIALYRTLMSSPVFCYIHKGFWNRDLKQPRLVAWNEADQKRLPAVWNNFTQELNASTNSLAQLEAKAIYLADATNEMDMAAAFTNFFNTVFLDAGGLTTKNVDVSYEEWGIDDLFEHLNGGLDTAARDSLQRSYFLQYRQKLDDQFQAAQFSTFFEKQKHYLKINKPYEFFEFAILFQTRTYTKSQALEIEPLVAAYQSNLVVQSQKTPVMQRGELIGAIAQVGFLKDTINRIIHPPAPPHTPPSQIQTAGAAAPPAMAAATIAPKAPETVTNVITVNKFIAIPLDGLMRLGGLETINSSRLIIVEHDGLEGKLLLGFEYNLMDNQYGAVYGSAIAIFDPATENWQVISCPKVDFESKNLFPHHSALLQGELFNCDDGKIEKYDSQNQAWRALSISDGNNYELFAVNGHLYTANTITISEITADGQSTHILASTRRQPPASALDTQLLGAPTLFEGPNHSLRVYTHGKIFSWTGSDWREDGAAPPVSSMPEAFPNGMYVPFGPEIFPDGVVFDKKGTLEAGYANGNITRNPDGSYGTLRTQDSISCLQNEDDAATLYLQGKPDWAIHFSGPSTPPDHASRPACMMPANLIPGLPVALRHSDLYLLEDAFALHAVINQQHEVLQDDAAAGNEYNAALLCFSKDFSVPQKIYLKFEPAAAKSPDWLLPAATNWLFCGNSTGIWMLPLSRLDSAINAQKQIQLAQKTQADMAIIQARQKQAANLLAKYDLNHNGTIDPDEKEAALNDPAFIESQLDVIDLNHNGQLDLEELAYFDANQNQLLEPKEQAGLEIAQHLLAKRDLEKFDADGDGVLNREEFFALLQADNMRGFTPSFFFLNADENHDGKIELTELESFLKQSLRRKLHPTGVSSMAFVNQIQAEGGNPATVARQLFKLEVEAYWRDPGSITNRPQFNHVHTAGAFFPPNGPLPTVRP